MHVEDVYVDCTEMYCRNMHTLQTVTVATYRSYIPGKAKNLGWSFFEKHISGFRVITQPNRTTTRE